MEIERKFLIPTLPDDLAGYENMLLEQAYLNTDPVVRVRREGGQYVLTYKGRGFLSREEYNLPLNEASYEHLKQKADGRIITKTRYRIPISFEDQNLFIELDVFHGDLAPLCMAEVEFPSKESALRFQPPAWFGKEVTYDPAYHNSSLSRLD